MQSKLQQIKQDLKDARNFGYLGKYDQSIKQYKKIVDSIQQQIILNNISKKSVEDWRVFQGQVIQQKSSVQYIKSMLSGITLNTSSLIKTQEKQSPFDNHSINQYDNRFRITNNNNFRATNRGFSANRNKQSSQNNQNNKVFKDPDVWDSPPPPIQKRQSVQKVNKINQNANYNQKNHQIRNLPPKKKGQNNGKNNFMNDRYPEGNGPDKNLIEMLQKEVLDKSPNILFENIADLQSAKTLLQEAVLLPLRMPQFFTGIRRAWKGVLMFGPPGTGKTLLAKAVASSGGTTFFNVSASSLASKWKGQSEKLVRILFEMAKFYAPSVIFFDQIDALGGKRKENQDQSNRKVKTELLVQMDGATSSSNEQNKFVIVLAATNRPWDLDEALRRRLEKRIYIPLPTQKGRRELLKINLKQLKLSQTVDLEPVVKKTEGYSGADISNLCREAAMLPMRRKLKNEGGFKNITDMKKFQEQINTPLKQQDLIQALKNVNKSVGSEDLHKYEKWMKQFGTI